MKVFLSILVALTLVGCGKGNNNAASGENTKPPVTPGTVPTKPKAVSDLENSLAKPLPSNATSAAAITPQKIANERPAPPAPAPRAPEAPAEKPSISTTATLAAAPIATPNVSPVPFAAKEEQPAQAAKNSGTLSSLANNGGIAGSLPVDQLTQGLKEALGKGVQSAIAKLGADGGFLTNVDVRIPVPDKFKPVETALRRLGQDKIVDDFIGTMNHAAEQAVPLAADVFGQSLRSMTIADAQNILQGAPDAATQFFKRTTETELRTKFAPIVQSAMAKTGVTAAYEQLLSKAKFATPFLNATGFDLDSYVTGKTLDGVFIKVAEEEKKIRENPAARTTDLLKSVFGLLKK